MKSLNKIFRIIDLFKENKNLKFKEISQKLNLPKSTTHRLLAELIKNSYITKDNNNVYKLGHKFLEIANYILNDFDIRETAKENIDRLNEITKETIHLAVLIGKEAIYIDKRESQSPIRMYSQVGKAAPIYCTGVGKVLLAFQKNKVLHELLDNISYLKYTENTIVSKDLLLEELHNIRKKGYAIDREEHENNIGCIAAPIKSFNNLVVGALSITTILYNKKFEEILKYKDLLLEECKNISTKLGC